MRVKTASTTWSCTVKFYGPPKAIAAQWDYAKEKFSAIAGAKFEDGESYKLPLTPEQFNIYLKELIADLKKSGAGHKAKARLMLIGSVMTNTEFIKSIEELGVIVVTDELCTSTRYWSDPVILEGAKNPLEAVSRRYLNNFPCARMYPGVDRFDRIVKLAREARVDGIISETIRYCVPYAHDIPLLSDRLK